MRLKPFYQGKLDVFCAMYAVLNGLRITHGIRTLKARDILNETLLGLASRPAAFRAALNQETDYVALVDAMLATQAKRLRLDVRRPFGGAQFADVDTFWNACGEWLKPGGEPAQNRAIVVRFSKYFDPAKPPLIRHWTTIDSIDDHNLHLFDSSHDAESIQNLPKNAIATRAADIDGSHKLHIQPDTARFMGLPCG